MGVVGGRVLETQICCVRLSELTSLHFCWVNQNNKNIDYAAAADLNQLGQKMSQSGSSEVSKKLKAAIRAKLEELGVYVDDELPDYIMVMIANKKEKSHMKEDLSLFIGKNTAKFVDWLFDLFDRLQTASTKQNVEKSASSLESQKIDEDKKKDEKKQKEHERQKQEEREKKEKEDREKEKEREKEREREREKERERDRQRKKLTKEKERKIKTDERSKRRRSRSNTYSDEEGKKRSRKNSDLTKHEHKKHESRATETKKVASTVVSRKLSTSPEHQKVHSTVIVKRNLRPVGDEVSAKGRSNMFLRAMNDASVSAGYASNLKKSTKEREFADDDMSDVDALPTKPKSLKERLEFINKNTKKEENGNPVEDDAIVVKNKPVEGGPQMIVKLAGGKEAIKKLKMHQRIVIMDKKDRTTKRSGLKRKIDDEFEPEEEPKSKHDRIVFDLTPPKETSDSPTLKKWNGTIQLGEESETSDEEAEIDALLAETQEIGKKLQDDEELPPTHQLSGGNYSIHLNPQYNPPVPSYIPTPLNVLQEQQNQVFDKSKVDNNTKERCIFWPKCTKLDNCQFHHPVKNCANFPNCTFGNRCLFIHPPCRFDKFCTKNACPFTHHGTGGVQPQTSNLPFTSNRSSSFVGPKSNKTDLTSQSTTVPIALSSIGAKLAASLEAKKKTGENKPEPKSEENNEVQNKTEVVKQEPGNENEKREEKSSTEPVEKLQNLIPCRYAAACRNPGCYFKHPKECKFGTNCRNASCYFYHKPAAVQPSEPSAKYKWSATA